jgi:uridylate kinase
MEQNMKVVVLNASEPDILLKVANGEQTGTIVSG